MCFLHMLHCPALISFAVHQHIVQGLQFQVSLKFSARRKFRFFSSSKQLQIFCILKISTGNGRQTDLNITEYKNMYDLCLIPYPTPISPSNNLTDIQNMNIITTINHPWKHLYWIYKRTHLKGSFQKHFICTQKQTYRLIRIIVCIWITNSKIKTACLWYSLSHGLVFCFCWFIGRLESIM